MQVHATSIVAKATFCKSPLLRGYPRAGDNLSPHMGTYVKQEELDWCSERMTEAVRRWANGSADEFGRLLGYANGGFIREVMGKKKPIGKAIRSRLREHMPELEVYLTYPGLSSGQEFQLAHTLSYQPDTVPYLTREELMTGKDLPNAFKIDLPDDALGAKAPSGTRATFECRPPAWGDAVLLFDAKGQPHVRVYRQSLEHDWEGVAPNPAFATFTGSMSGVRVVAVLESLGGGWAQLSR
jgi:hypothetical protein